MMFGACGGRTGQCRKNMLRKHALGRGCLWVGGSGQSPFPLDGSSCMLTGSTSYFNQMGIAIRCWGYDVFSAKACYLLEVHPIQSSGTLT